MIFLTTGSVSTSDVPFRTEGRGASLLGPASEELAEGGVVGDFFAAFSGELLTEEETDFTGDVAGDGGFTSSLGFSAAGDADGAGAGAGASSGEPGFGRVVLWDCSTTTGSDAAPPTAVCGTSAFEAIGSVVSGEGFGDVVLGGGETSEPFGGTDWVGTTLAGTSGSF